MDYSLVKTEKLVDYPRLTGGTEARIRWAIYWLPEAARLWRTINNVKFEAKDQEYS